MEWSRCPAVLRLPGVGLGAGPAAAGEDDLAGARPVYVRDAGAFLEQSDGDPAKPAESMLVAGSVLRVARAKMAKPAFSAVGVTCAPSDWRTCVVPAAAVGISHRLYGYPCGGDIVG